VAGPAPAWLLPSEGCSSAKAAKAVAFDFAPVDQAISCGPYCDCPGCWAASENVGYGTTCAQARADRDAKLAASAQAVCAYSSPCQLIVTETSGCYATYAPGIVGVRGYAEFGCMDNNC
jgi:hypothetical protein